jgi:hypothetical protein
LLVQWLIDKFVASTYSAWLDEVHLEDGLPLVVDDIFVHVAWEEAWFESVD